MGNNNTELYSTHAGLDQPLAADHTVLGKNIHDLCSTASLGPNFIFFFFFLLVIMDILLQMSSAMALNIDINR